jgi:hypothetical protein
MLPIIGFPVGYFLILEYESVVVQTGLFRLNKYRLVIKADTLMLTTA